MEVRYLIGGAVLALIVPAGQAAAQKTHREPAHNVTLLGCVMREADYRATYGPGLTGVRGPGIGLKDEYMLVDAKEIPSGSQPTDEDAAKPCPQHGATFPAAYELKGSKEKEIAEYVGHRVVLTGMQHAAKVRAVGTAGEFRPTGGFDPLGHDLALFEVDPENFHDVNATLAKNTTVTTAAPAPAPAATEAAAAPAPAPEAPAAAPEPEQNTAAAPAPAPEQNTAAAEPPAPAQEPAPVATSGQNEQPKQVASAELPNTASPMPWIGLIGLLALCAGAGMRLAFGRD